jgi:asparagine synthase (glutamine-hydrolysing)
MCGICGYVSRNGITETQLERMNDTLRHRGPDDAGTWTTENNGYHIGLAQRRLSIFDLSPLGHQPMFSPDGNLVIVFNGEIYNFQTLRRQLEGEGYSFKSSCDTEVLLAAYQKWGGRCLDFLQGMFAFAIYDCAENTLFFARDRVGKKPFYYYHDGKVLIFASELKAIMEHPEFKKELKTEEISKYLCHSYIEAANTIFRNTYKLEGGCQMTWERGNLTITRYYDYFQQFTLAKEEMITDFKVAKTGLTTLLEKNVAERLVADVPVGVFLSAGIDSSVVAGTAAKMSAKQVKTFTIGFHDQERNEAPGAKRIAEHLGTDHVELYIEESELLSLLEEIPLYYDEPFADPSQIPTMALSSLARQEVTVALSGDGGDEFFCGYKMYDWLYWARILDKPAGLLYSLTNAPMKSLLPNTARALVNNRNADYKVQLFTDVREEFIRDIVKTPYGSPKFDIEREIPARHWQEKRMLLDIVRYLPDDVLTKVDRASMKYALEARCPLLDRSIAEYSFRLPHSFKYHHRQKKWILKQVAYDMIPQELLDMPKKGFGVPLAKWLNGPLSTKVQQFTDKTVLEKQGLFNHQPLTVLVNKVAGSNSQIYSLVLWNFLVFQMWYQRYVEDLWGGIRINQRL